MEFIHRQVVEPVDTAADQGEEPIAPVSASAARPPALPANASEIDEKIVAHPNKLEERLAFYNLF